MMPASFGTSALISVFAASSMSIHAASYRVSCVSFSARQYRASPRYHRSASSSSVAAIASSFRLRYVRARTCPKSASGARRSRASVSWYSWGARSTPPFEVDVARRRARHADTAARQRVDDIEDSGQPTRNIRRRAGESLRDRQVSLVGHAELVLAKREERGGADGSRGGGVGRGRNRPQRVVVVVGREETVEASRADLSSGGRKPRRRNSLGHELRPSGRRTCRQRDDDRNGTGASHRQVRPRSQKSGWTVVNSASPSV